MIIAILPDSVKKVLEERSPEYQRLMFPDGRRREISTNKTRKNDTDKKNEK